MKQKGFNCNPRNEQWKDGWWQRKERMGREAV